MNNSEKSNSVRNRKRKLNKEYFLVSMLELLGIFWGTLIYSTAAVYVFPFAAVLLSILRVDTFWYVTIMSGINLFLRFIPISVMMLCEAKKEVINDRIKKLNAFGNVEIVNKNKKVSKKEDEKQKILFEEIVSKIEKLPRKKQVDILNYIKEDFISNNMEIDISIDMLNEDNIEILQDKIEDILWSDFGQDDENYTRSKRKY